MKKNLILPGFSKLLGGRGKKSALEVLGERIEALRTASTSQLESLFEALIPVHLFEAVDQRERKYPARVVFWAFLSQVLSEGRSQGSLRHALRQIQSYRGTKESTNTSALCKARKRLPMKLLESINERVLNHLQCNEMKLQGFGNRRVLLIDRTHLRAPDSADNQHVFPQNARCGKGCGFPEVCVTAMFDLIRGAWLKSSITDSSVWEGNAAMIDLLPDLHKGNIVVMDRLYQSYAILVSVLEQKADFVVRAKEQNLANYEVVKSLNRNDRIIRLKRPQNRNELFQETWGDFPKEQRVRLVSQKGYDRDGKPVIIHLMTSLLDAELYPLESLMWLYKRRWRIEISFRDVKVTMGLEALRTQSAEMIQKEILMYQIAYNLIRSIHLEVYKTYGVAIDRLSVKGTIDTLLSHAHLFHRFRLHPLKLRVVREQVLELVARDKIPKRKERWEPRVRKHRNRGKTWMTRPRQAYKTEREINLKNALS